MLHLRKLLSIMLFLFVCLLALLVLFVLQKLFPVYTTILRIIWNILLPFLIAGLIAYILHPLINKLNTWKLPKSFSILLIYLLFFGGGALAIYYFYPIFLVEMEELSERLPKFIQEYDHVVENIYASASFLPEAMQERITQFIHGLEHTISDKLTMFMEKTTKLFDWLLIVLIVPVLVFYLLKDFEDVTRFMKKFISSKYHVQVKEICHIIDVHFGNYLRGQLLVSAFIIFSTYIIFDLFQLKYALLLAIILGVTNLIPYFGPLIGAIPAIIVAMTMSKTMIIVVIVTILGTQLIENSFISPYVIGKMTKIHPITIILALLIGGQIGGIIGMVLIVPIVTIGYAIIKNLPRLRQSV